MTSGMMIGNGRDQFAAGNSAPHTTHYRTARHICIRPIESSIRSHSKRSLTARDQHAAEAPPALPLSATLYEKDAGNK
jgi:hypothetical protein